MKRILAILFLFSFLVIHAEKENLSSQFLKLLAPIESQQAVLVPAKKSEKPQSQSPKLTKESEVKRADQKLDPFLHLLTMQEISSEKLYKEDLEAFNFKYINYLEYADECEGFPEFDEKKLTKNEKELTKKYTKLIAKGYEVPWYVQYINEQVGHGAFAAEDIEAGQMIGEYTGIIIESANIKDLDLSYGWTIRPPENYSNPAEIFFVDARKAGNFTRFINHSSYPNTKAITVYYDGAWHIVYVASKPIKKDQQLLVDYGAGYWTRKTVKPVEFALAE